MTFVVLLNDINELNYEHGLLDMTGNCPVYLLQDINSQNFIMPPRNLDIITKR